MLKQFDVVDDVEAVRGGSGVRASVACVTGSVIASALEYLSAWGVR